MKLYKIIAEIEFGKTVRGIEHPDIVIVDDFFDGDKPVSEVERQKMYKFMNQQVIPNLKKGGKIFFGSIDCDGMMHNLIQSYPFKIRKTADVDKK